MCHIYVFSYLLGVLCFPYMFYSFFSFPCDILISRYKRETTRSYIGAYMFYRQTTIWRCGYPRKLLSSLELGDHHEFQHEERTHLANRPKAVPDSPLGPLPRECLYFSPSCSRRWISLDSRLCVVIEMLEGSSSARNFSCHWPLAIFYGIVPYFWWR